MPEGPVRGARAPPMTTQEKAPDPASFQPHSMPPFHQPRAGGGGGARPGQPIDADLVRLEAKTAGEAAQQTLENQGFGTPIIRTPSKWLLRSPAHDPLAGLGGPPARRRCSAAMSGSPRFS
jgi:hypothetical protein